MLNVSFGGNHLRKKNLSGSLKGLQKPLTDLETIDIFKGRS